MVEPRMPDLFAVLVLVLFYPVLAALGTRAQLHLFPRLRNHPGQGIFTRSAAAGFGLLFLLGLLWTGPEPALSARATHLAVILGCEALVLISLFCVSESGRRFYLISLIDREENPRLSSLKVHYGRRQMLERRLERLRAWNVLRETGGQWVLQRRGAWLYSFFFYAWGRLLGYKWFDHEA